MLLFLLAVSVATGVLFGLAPVVQILRVAPGVAMKSGALPGGGSSRVRSVLVVFEFALALMLATGAGILAKSFLRLVRVDPGFDSRGILTLRLSVPPSRDASVLYPRIEQRLLSLPGVRSVAVANALPLIADRSLASRVNVPGSPLINPDALPDAQTRFISPGYFEAMGLPLRSGRAFTARDLNQPVAIVNQTMAQRFWPQDPAGRKFITGVWGSTPSYSTIVGVAADVKQFGLDSEATMDLYYPVLAPRYLILGTAGDPQSLAAAAERELRSIDPGIPVSDIRTMDAILAESPVPGAGPWRCWLLSPHSP